jgi:hypothetical protein
MNRELSTLGKIVGTLCVFGGLFIGGSKYGGPGLAFLRDFAKPAQANVQPVNAAPLAPRVSAPQTARTFAGPQQQQPASAPQAAPAAEQAPAAPPVPVFTEPGAPLDAPAFDPQTSSAGVNPATRGQMRVAPVEAQEEPPAEAAPVHPATGGQVATSFGDTAILNSSGTEFDGQEVTIVSANESGTVTIQLPDGEQINVLKMQLGQP